MLALLELLQLALRRRNGELLREKVVLGVALSDVYDVALATLALDLTKKNDFHEISYPARRTRDAFLTCVPRCANHPAEACGSWPTHR